jgi:hypothetical protein
MVPETPYLTLGEEQSVRMKRMWNRAKARVFAECTGKTGFPGVGFSRVPQLVGIDTEMAVIDVDQAANDVNEKAVAPTDFIRFAGEQNGGRGSEAPLADRYQQQAPPRG